MKTLLGTILTTAAAFACQTSVSAATLSVPATSNIFGAGHATPPDSGTLPPSVTIASGSTFVTFASVAGTITLNGGGNFNDADGVGAAVASSSTTSLNGISGLTAPNAGYLVGIFETAAEPADPAPTALNFVTTGTSFSTLSPVLDQTFFIGDGLTGDGTGATQRFVVPAGATRLFLGITDAGGYNGSPGSYGDNSGTFVATLTVVPEPSSLALAGLGIAALAAWRKRRRA